MFTVRKISSRAESVCGISSSSAVPITFENVDDTLKIKEGEDVTIRCEVTGQPLPKVDWLFNGIPLKENLSKLRLK